MAHGTIRKCPLLIEPEQRTMTRREWKHVDHALRLVWHNCHEQLQKDVVDLMIYGGLPEPDGSIFRGRSLLSVVEALGKPVGL